MTNSWFAGFLFNILGNSENVLFHFICSDDVTSLSSINKNLVKKTEELSESCLILCQYLPIIHQYQTTAWSVIQSADRYLLHLQEGLHTPVQTPGGDHMIPDHLLLMNHWWKFISCLCSAFSCLLLPCRNQRECWEEVSGHLHLKEQSLISINPLLLSFLQSPDPPHFWTDTSTIC